MMRLRLVKDNLNFDFFKRWRLWVGVSALLMVLSVVSVAVQGLNFGIDFRGGTTIRAQSTAAIDVAQYRDLLAPLELGDISIAEIFDPNFAADQNVVQIRIQAQADSEAVSSDTIRNIEQVLGTEFGGGVVVATVKNIDAARLQYDIDGAQVTSPTTLELPAGVLGDIEDQLQKAATLLNPDATVTAKFRDFSFPAVDSVGPKVSGELIQSAILAIVTAIAVVLIYIWLRFEWQFALGAVAALVHDVILTIGIFSVLQIKFDLAIIAALLTIVGYSLNDTVVVFDRVRENLRRFKKKQLDGVLNLSINETMSRTLMTSVTTLLALGSLFVLGGDVIRGFVFAMIFGVVVGTYSSIFVASSALLWLGVKRDWSKPSNTEGNQFANIDA